MKKFLAGLLSVVVCMSFVGCADDTNESKTEEVEVDEEQAFATKKIELYNKLLGTWTSTEAAAGFKSITFKDDCVILGDTTLADTSYNIDKVKSLYLKDEVDTLLNANAPYLNTYPAGAGSLLIKFGSSTYFGGDDYVHISSYLLNPDTTNKDYKNNPDDIFVDSYFFEFNSVHNDEFKFSKSTATNQDNSDSSSLAGTYKFITAIGTQTNGSISLSNGTWTYSGNKTAAAATSGTYTVEGSKVTVKWTAGGAEVSETFTVTTSDSSSTWKSDNAYTSVFLSMLFGVSATEITFTYSE